MGKAKKPLQFKTTPRVQKLSTDTAMQALAETLQRTEDRESKLRGIVSELETELHKAKELQHRRGEELGAWMDKCRKEAQKVSGLEERLHVLEAERESMLVRRTQLTSTFIELRNAIRAGAVVEHGIDMARGGDTLEGMDSGQRLLWLLWWILAEAE